MKTEHTSKRIASVAGLILGAEHFSGGFCVYSAKRWHVIRIEDMRAMAGSLVTQAQDHAEREIIRKGKLPKGHRRIKVHKPVFRNGKAKKAAQLRGKRK